MSDPTGTVDGADTNIFSGLSALDALDPMGTAASMAVQGAKAAAPAVSSAVGSATSAIAGSIFGQNLGNAVLVGVGIVLGLGALLIGSRETIVNVQSKVANTARMFV